MRLWHLTFGVLLVAIALSVARDPVGLVALIVFVTGLGEVVVGTAALLALFQSVGSFGEARGLPEHAEAVVATTVVLAVSSSMMTGLFFVGAWLVKAATA
jgi:hypothetical protein